MRTDEEYLEKCRMLVASARQDMARDTEILISMMHSHQTIEQRKARRSADKPWMHQKSLIVNRLKAGESSRVIAKEYNVQPVIIQTIFREFEEIGLREWKRQKRENK